MARREWLWNDFKGGLSDSPLLGQPGQYGQGLNIDVQTEPVGFKLSGKNTQYRTTNTQPNVILDLADFGGSGIYTFCEGGEIYKDLTVAPIYTEASAILSATAIWESTGVSLVIVYFTATNAIYIQQNGTGRTVIGTTASTSPYPLIRYGNDIYFGEANKFRKIDNVLASISTIFTASKENIFTGITFFQDSFHLYSKMGLTSNPVNGQQFIIRVGETSPDYVTKWDKLPILGASNNGATDYVITGFGPNYSDLYQVTGTQRKLIKSNFEGMTAGRKFVGPIVSWKDEQFLIGWNQEGGALPGGNSIFRLGQYFPGLPTALTEIYRGLTSSNRVYCLNMANNGIYFGNKKSGSFYVDLISLDTPIVSYADDGYIISPIYDGGDRNARKSFISIEVSYMCDASNPYFPHGGTVSLYARKSQGDGFIFIKSFTKTDIGRVIITANEIAAANFGDFYQLEYQILLTKGSLILSPLTTSVRTIYDDNIQP